MVVCRDEDLAERVRRLRFHGSKDKVVFDEVGYNSRLDDLQAAIIRVFYPHLDDWNARRAPGRRLVRGGGARRAHELPGRRPGRPPHLPPVHGAAPRSATGCARPCRRPASACAVYYGIPMHLQPVFARLGYREGDLPVAEEAARTALALPMHPNLRREDVTEVVGAARRALERLEAAATR